MIRKLRHRRRMQLERLESRWVMDGALPGATGLLDAEGEGDTIVNIRLETASLGGDPITEIGVGEDFLIRAYAQDVREFPDLAEGIFAIYLDVTYDAALATATGQAMFGDDFVNAPAFGDVTTDGLIDEVGAFVNAFSGGPEELLVFSYTMQADAVGEIQFGSDPAEGGGFDILVFGIDDPVPAEQVMFGQTSITVTGSLAATDDSFTVDEDSQDNSLDVLDNDVLGGAQGDVDITAVGATSNGGVVQIAGDGQSLLYTPAADFFGTETFQYTISDGVQSATANVQVQVTAEDRIFLTDDSFTVDEDSTANSLDVLDNDDLGGLGDAVITAVGTTSNGGDVSIENGGTVLFYSPAANFSGTDTFTYTVQGGSGMFSDTATVTVTVDAVGDDPVAVDDTFDDIDENSTGNDLDVLDNDTDPDGDTLTIIEVTQPSQGGTVSIAGDDLSLTYTPATNFSGTIDFTYTISDGTGRTDTATVTVTVGAVPDPPVAVDDEFDVDEDSATTSLDVLDNDTDADGDTLTITAVGAASLGGSVSIAGNGSSIDYSPAADAFGTETFTYTISDGTGRTDTATVTVTIDAVADDPVAVDDSFDDIDANSTDNELDVLDNDTDADGDTLTIISVQQPASGGTVAISEDDLSLLFTPDEDFTDTVQFSYTISDGTGRTDSAMVTVDVRSPFDGDVSGWVMFEGSKPVGGVPVELSGTDTDGDSVTRTVVTDAQGRFHFDELANGSYTVSSDSQVFLLGNGAQTSVESLPEAPDSEGNTLNHPSRAPAFIGIGDYLTTTPREYVMAAIDTTDGTRWYSTTGGWEEIADLEMELAADFSQLVLTATHDDGRVFEATLTDLTLQGVHLLGSEGTTHLVRVPGSFSDLDFVETDDGEGEGEGEFDAEGEASAELAMLADAEGESAPSEAVFGQTSRIESTPPPAMSDAEGESTAEATAPSSSPARASAPVLRNPSAMPPDDSAPDPRLGANASTEDSFQDHAILSPAAVDAVMADIGRDAEDPIEKPDGDLETAEDPLAPFALELL